MRYLCAAAFILLLTISHPGAPRAQGNCFERKPAIAAIHMRGFVPVAELEVEGRPAIIFVNGQHEYIVMSWDHKTDTVCKVAQGQAFYFVKWRKA